MFNYRYIDFDEDKSDKVNRPKGNFSSQDDGLEELFSVSDDDEQINESQNGETHRPQEDKIASEDDVICEELASRKRKRESVEIINICEESDPDNYYDNDSIIDMTQD